MYRSGQMLNVCGEKVDQALISSIMKEATKTWGNEYLVDYACAESNLLLKGLFFIVNPSFKPWHNLRIDRLGSCC